MGSIIANSLIERASELAQDEQNITWETSQALAWLNDGQRAVVSVRPDASVSVGPITLAPGTRQSIQGLRLMGLTMNLGIDGVTPGKAIRLVERGIKDDFDPDWHTAQPSATVLEYIYDVLVPKEFYVSPPVVTSPVVTVEAKQAVRPADVVNTASPISIDDTYGPALIEWMAYRFFARDAEETPGLQRAVTHFQSFFMLMGEKVKVDLAVNPKVRAQLDE